MAIKRVFFLLILLPSSTLAIPQRRFGPLFGDIEHQTGTGVACVGTSISNSGAADFVIGSPEVTASNFGGIAQVISGKDGTSVQYNGGGGSGERFGEAVAAIGDVTADGVTDFLIGIPGADRAVIAKSQGGAFFELNVTALSAGLIGTSLFGAAVSGFRGPVSGTSGAAVMIGAPNYSISLSFPSTDGSVSFFDPEDGVFLYKCNSVFNSSEELGAALSPVGDIDNDGAKDYIIGAPGASGDDGRVIVNSGTSAASCTTIYSLPGSQGARLGTSVTSLPDIDGDGVDEIIAGGPNFSDTLSNRGTAILYSGRTGSVLCTQLGTAGGDRLGTSVANVGDINYDGRPDIAIGAPGANSGFGAVRIISFNPATSSCSILTTLDGSVRGEGFGRSLAGETSGSPQCDMNTDGYNEFIVGTSSDTVGTDRGSVFVYTVPTPTPTRSPTPIRTVSPQPTRATPLPSRSRLNFRIEKDGNLTATAAFDLNPRNRCTMRLIGKYSKVDLTGVSATRIFVSSKRALRAINKFQARALPKAEYDMSCDRPYILHLLVRNDCEGKTFSSNVASRYLNCGVDPAVPVDNFMSVLRSKIR